MKSIKDVALEAKVSVATVSRTLQMPASVAPHTRERVLAAVRKLGYTPNAQARNLRTAKTNLVVALVHDISNLFYSGVVRGIEHVANQNGYSVLLGVAGHNDFGREKRYADLVSARQADGLITLLPHIPKIAGLAGKMPLVSVSENATDNVFGVHIDNVRAVRDAVEYLFALGHRDIAFVGGRKGTSIAIDRERGFREAYSAARLQVRARLLTAGDYTIESGIRAVDSLFAQEIKFTAVFCCNDEMAIGAYQSIRAHGLRVPDDISVVGFDDVQISRFLDPPLSTVAQPVEEMGREAMTMLLELLREGEGPPRKHILPTNLVIRGSTARPPTR